MAGKIKINREHLKRYLIDQFIYRFKPHQKVTTVEYDHIAPLECVQMDTLRIIERNQDLVLHNRFDNYRPAMLTDIAYNQKKLIESFYNAMCFVPTSEYRYHRHRHREIGQEFGHNWQKFKSEISLVKRIIRKQGPLPASYFKSSKKQAWGYGSGLKNTTIALDFLWYSGQLMTAFRESGQRYYDFPENVLLPEIDRSLPSLKQYRQFMLNKHLRTYILGDLSYHRFGNMRMKAVDRRKLIEPQVKNGDIVHLDIEDMKRAYVIRKIDLDRIQPISSYKPDKRVRFMAPLDNLLFNRDMISDIFCFDYRWEVYAPRKKRKFGYYVMPILYGFDFIGRIDPKADRKANKLIFHLIQIEDHVKLTDRLITEISRAIKRMAGFSNMKSAEVTKTQPAKLKKLLQKKL
jgi:uncharacterized protein